MSDDKEARRRGAIDRTARKLVESTGGRMAPREAREHVRKAVIERERGDRK